MKTSFENGDSNMSYRRRNNGASGSAGDSPGVRGPNSALTEFLREHGITDELIRRRQMTLNEAEAEDEEGVLVNDQGENGDEQLDATPGNARRSSTRSTRSQSRNDSASASASVLPEAGGEGRVSLANGDIIQVDEDDDEEELQIRIAARRKRRLAKKNESDYTDSEGEDGDNDGDDIDGNGGIKANGKLFKKKILGPGQETTCSQCGNLFTISTFSKKIKDETGGIMGYLCRDCTKIVLEKDRSKRQKELQARKKRRKLAEALLDRQELKFPSLQDLCIQLVIKYIGSIDAFGDIGHVNMKKICRILCKNRLLTDDTLPLFLSPDVKELELWDCAKLSVTSMKKVASFCPNLTHLNFAYCGRLNNSVFDYYTSQLSDLTSVHFYGAFLIADDSWLKFFQKFGPQLKKFTLKQSYRFTDRALVGLVELCPNLEELSLSRLDGVIHRESYAHIAKLTKLKHLEISKPANENLVPDDTIITIAKSLNKQLESLVLDECTGLTDVFLIEGIRPYCSELKKLSLKVLDQITDVGVLTLFDSWEANSGLISLDLYKCILLLTNSMIEVINHSHDSLIELNINSLNELDSTFFEVVAVKKLPLLTTLDCGFVRAVDNKVIELLGKACPKLKILEVYGNNRCTSAAKIRKGLQVIGRQSDSI